VNYYVVGPPVDGQQEYLFAIAAAALGDGSRSNEIFELNRGRRQPDGGALVDPAVLHPGWILLLPADASGPRVLTGPLPVQFTDGPPGTGWPAASPTTPWDDQNRLLDGVGLVAMVAVMLLAIMLLRRGTRLSLPGGLGRVIGGRGGVVPPDAGHGAQVPTPSGTGGVADGDYVDDPLAATALTGPHSEVTAARVLTASGEVGATVRLTGVRMPRATPAWLWLDPDGPTTPPAPTYVVVGAGDRGSFCLDLTQAPDVVTVTGDGAQARRLAATMARQLVDQDVAVTVVGAAIGPRIDGVHAVRSMIDAEAATDDPTAPQVVFCEGDQDDIATVRRLVARSTPRTVVVLVGDVRRGRWSVDVRPARSEP
jgi:hypothetical protein